MRKTFVGVTVLALSVALAAPALAKGPGELITESHATIQGRGLASPIRVTSHRDCGVAYPCYSFADLEDPLVNLATLTGIVYGPPQYAKPYDVAPGGAAGLGPRYEVTYSVTFDDGVTRSVRQDVYPWAGAHGWIFTPAGQRLVGRDLDPGWMPAPTTLRTALIDLGVPSNPPPAEAAPIAESPAASPVAVIGITSALLFLLVAGGVMVARARHTRPAITA